MKLYTSKAVAAWLGLTDRRVRQLRDEGVLPEAQPGLWELRGTVTRYITYLRKGSNDLNDERAKLTAEKRKAAERENRIQDGMVHKTEDIERAVAALCLNIRGRIRSIPAKLAPQLATMGGRRDEIFDVMRQTLDEALEELSDPRVALAKAGAEDEDDA